MADTTEKRIYLALADAAAALVLPTGWDKAYQGVSYTPTATSKFISFEIHMNTPIETDLSLQMDPIRQGFMRANVMLPKNRPAPEAYEVAGIVRLAFRRGTKFLREGVQVRIDEDPSLATLMTGDTHHQIPVTVFWRSYFQPA